MRTITMNRVAFLVDGFNLYHSAVDAQVTLGGATTKWLNIKSLCNSYLQTISRDAQIQNIFYFSAFAYHRICAANPDVVKRHKTYLTCLEDTGIISFMHKFTKIRNRHEEKKTDVAIAAKIFEELFYDNCETIALVSGDTDLVPAIETAKRIAPNKSYCIISPYKRANKQLIDLADLAFKIRPSTMISHQFTDPYILSDGRKMHKPTSW